MSKRSLLKIDKYYLDHADLFPKNIKTRNEAIEASYRKGYRTKLIAKTYHISEREVKKISKNVDKTERKLGERDLKDKLNERARKRLDYALDKEGALRKERRRMEGGFRQAHDPYIHSDSKYWHRGYV